MQPVANKQTNNCNNDSSNEINNRNVDALIIKTEEEKHFLSERRIVV